MAEPVVPVALITHADCLEHDTGPFHPERADRLRAVWRALSQPEFDQLLRLEAPETSRDELVRAHPASYVDKLLAVRVPAGKHVQLDADTLMSSGSLRAALRAAGGAIAGVDTVLSEKASAAFVAVRPPGHHAEPARPMGFCLFGNVGVAAQHARARWGLRRIAVADFDVHHGNGTQAMFAPDAELCFASSHQHPCYPGTGLASERGVAGNVINAPLPPGTGSAAFRAAWSGTLLPAIERFAPELLIVSAGFDAHRADPLAELNLDAADFGWLTAQLKALAERCCGGRMVSVLEGGYDLDALAQSSAAHVRALMS